MKHDILIIAQLTAPAHQALDRCALCGALIPVNGPPLCPACEQDENERWEDYRAEMEQARRPL